MINAQNIILFCLSVLLPMTVSLILHFGPIKYNVPQNLRDSSMRKVMLIYFFVYQMLLIIVTVLAIFILYQHKYVDRDMIMLLAGYIFIIQFIAFLIFIYVYVRNIQELTSINLSELERLNDGIEEQTACNLPLEDDDTMKYNTLSFLYNHKVFLVHATIVTALFFMSFAFLKTMRIL